MERTQPRTVVLATEIHAHFPSMEWRRALAIARAYHANDKPVNGKSAHSTNYTEFLSRIVAAHHRHNGTNYDTLFNYGYSKELARTMVQPEISRQLAAWRVKP